MFPKMVHVVIVVDAKVTASPEVAEALTGNGAVPSGWFGSGPKVMLCVALVTWKLCVTGVAAT